ncbi:MAG: hypothetical protein NWE93_00780 [Candidatus Bathyarchaeota archaeon]|nr:hypothetical protein [Candidatus Bathyarchaeota archaeon]
MIILKCRECGNTFQKDGNIIENQAVSCPICDSNYRLVTKEGKVFLEDFEEEDLGEI